jgi:hypothetical protein
MFKGMPAQGGSALGGKNKIFAYSVLGLNVIAAWASWWVLASAVSGRIEHYWVFPALAFGIWGIFFTLNTIFVRNRTYLYSAYALCAAGYIFFVTISWSLIVIALTVLFLVMTERQIKKEIKRGIKVDFYHLVSHSLRYFVSAVCIVAAVAYFLSITHRPAPDPSAIESKSLEMELDWGLKAASYVLPEDKKEMVDDVANNITVDEFLSKNFVKPGIDENMAAVNNIIPGGATETAMLIGDATAEKMQEEMLAKSKRDLAKQLGVNVIGEQPMKEVLMAYIDKTERSFFEYSGTDKFYIPVILAFGLFLTARILGTAVDILLGVIILGIIKILRITGVISLNQVQKEVAEIEYSL